MSRNNSYFYRYLYKGTYVSMVYLDRITFHTGLFKAPDGKVLERHFSSFVA